MANKNRQIVVDLTLDTKDANKQIESVLNSVEGLAKKLGNGKDFSYFTDLINYLGKIEDKLKALQTADPISFENIFGKDAEKIVSQLDSAMSGLMDVPEKLMQAMNAISNTDFTGNLKSAKQAVELLIEVYERLGMEVPKSFDGFKNWKNSSLARHVQDIKDAANELRDIDWAQVFSIGGGSGGISSVIGKQVAEIERQIKVLEEQRDKYTQTLRSFDDEIPNELIGASVDEVNKYINDIMDSIDRIDAELKHLFSQKYELSSGSIFQDFNNGITEALKLDSVSDEFQAQLDKMQAMVDACGEKISGDLAADLQEIVDGFNAKDIDTTGIQSKMEAVIAKYQKVATIAAETGEKVSRANESINEGVTSDADVQKAEQQYEDLGDALDETGRKADAAQEKIGDVVDEPSLKKMNEMSITFKELVDTFLMFPDLNSLATLIEYVGELKKNINELADECSQDIIGNFQNELKTSLGTFEQFVQKVKEAVAAISLYDNIDVAPILYDLSFHSDLSSYMARIRSLASDVSSFYSRLDIKIPESLENANKWSNGVVSGLTKVQAAADKILSDLNYGSIFDESLIGDDSFYNFKLLVDQERQLSAIRDLQQELASYYVYYAELDDKIQQVDNTTTSYLSTVKKLAKAQKEFESLYAEFAAMFDDGDNMPGDYDTDDLHKLYTSAVKYRKEIIGIKNAWNEATSTGQGLYEDNFKDYLGYSSVEAAFEDLNRALVFTADNDALEVYRENLQARIIEIEGTLDKSKLPYILRNYVEQLYDSFEQEVDFGILDSMGKVVTEIDYLSQFKYDDVSPLSAWFNELSESFDDLLWLDDEALEKIYGGLDGTLTKLYDVLSKYEFTSDSVKYLDAIDVEFEEVNESAQEVASSVENANEQLKNVGVTKDTSGLEETAKDLQQQYNEAANAAKKLEEENKQLDQSLESARKNEIDWASRYYNADETVQQQTKEIDTLNTKLETTQGLLNSINGSGAGLSEEQFQGILQTLQEIVIELQQIGESVRGLFSSSGDTTNIQQMTEKLAEFGTISTTVAQEIKDVEELGFYDTPNVLDSFKKSALETQPVIENLIGEIESLYNENFKGNPAFDAMWAQFKNGAEQIQNSYQTIKDSITTDWALMGADSLNYGLQLISSSMEGVSQEVSDADKQVAKMSLDTGPLTEVLNRLAEVLEKVVDTFDQLKVNVTNTEFDAATQKIHELEQEVANLQEQLSGKTADASGIESTVEKIGSLLDLDALKGKAKDANVFERLADDFQTLENVLHNKDLANEDKVNRAIALYEALDQKIKTTATDAAVNNAFREQAKSLSDFGNSLRTALSLSGDTKNLKELNAVLKDMKENAAPENIKDYEKQIAQIFDDSGFDQIDLDFSAQLKSYVDELERLSNLDLAKDVKIFDSNDLAQFNSQIERSKDLIGSSRGIEEYNAQVKALQELLNGLNRQVTAAYQIQDSGGYIPITASSIEILQRNREELALYAESVRNLLTETGHTASARTVVEVIKDINAATDPVQLQNYRNELKAIMNDAGVSTKGLSTVDKTAMDDIETRLVNISKVSQEAGNIMGDMFSKVTTSGGLSFFKEQLESVEKEMSDGLGVQNLVNQVEQLDGLGVFSSDEIRGITDQVNNLKNAMGGMSSEQITAQVKGLQETVDLMDKVATTRLQSSSIDYNDFIPVDKLKGSVEELQAYVVSTFSNMGNLIDGSVQSKGQNAFQWIEKDAQGTLTEVTATFDKMGQVVVDKLNIDNVFNSSSKNSWLKTMKTDLTKTINDIISEMGKLMSMDVGSASYADAEARIQELLNKYQELASQLGNAANTQGFTDGLSKMFANFGAKVSKEIDDIQVKINSLWDSMDVGQEQSMYNQINQLFQVFDNFNNAATIDDKLASMKELQTLLPALASELDGYTQAQKEEAQATKEAAEAESVLTRSDTLSNNIQSWMKQNTAAAEQFKEKLDEILKSLDGNSDPAVLKKATEEFKNVQAQAKNAGAATDSFGKSLAQAALYAVGLGSTMSVFNKIVQTIREAVSIVTELDSAMAQLEIVTGATESEMNQFLESSISLAKELGQSVTDVLESITTFTRLGYNLEDSSTLSEFAGILANVANVDLSNATEGLTSVIKGFSLDVTDAEHISDVLITVGNNYAVSAEEILTAMTKSSAALDASGTSFEKAVAIVAAGNAAVQDASHNWLENHRNMIYRTHLIARTA